MRGHTLSVYGGFTPGKELNSRADRALPRIDRFKKSSFCVHTLPYPLVTLIRIFSVN